ncbi:hypothetical protein [Pseudohoeflea coraliihabitans]|uniref:Transposase n=1 Tax=Pseudohoeflea coraliihabitans TaxID=2860393 RepID=A0ABS6WN52_9HYPH|nr:hypothetical protein [Pseudohoeflea sp. DP4N28-3]MBW3097387.1 hypothetical protein [Pseudohoeflea sp. DP4N28-3]
MTQSHFNNLAMVFVAATLFHLVERMQIFARQIKRAMLAADRRKAAIQYAVNFKFIGGQGCV